MTRIAFAFVLLLLTHPAQAQLRGHGGPVRALAISADGQTAVSGSFDSSVIRWSLPRNAADQVLRFHQSAVNAVALTPDGRTVTGGEDGKIAIWQTGSPTPQRVLEGHVAPVVSLAVSPDGTTLASASWDRTIRLWSLTGGEQRVLEDHQQNVNGVAFTPDGKALVSAAYDLTLRIWPLDGGAPTIITLPTPLNSVAVSRDGEIVAGGADGRVFFFSTSGAPHGEIDSGQTPIVTVAVSGDGALVAAAGIRGSVAIIDRRTRTVVRTLVGPGLPVWSATFFPDNRTLLTGGTDRMIRRWDAVTGDHIGQVAMAGAEDPLAAYGDDRGAQVFRLPHAHPRRRQPRRPHAAGRVRPPDRDAAGVQFLAGAEEARHRVDAGDGVEAVRDRTDGLHARHQDAGADHRRGRGSQCAGEVSRKGDGKIIPLSRHGRAFFR